MQFRVQLRALDMTVRDLFTIYFVCVVLYPSVCYAMPLHDYIPVLDNVFEPREDLARKYFHLGFPYDQILVFLSKFYGIVLSLRHLKRLLKSLGLRRRMKHSSRHRVVPAIERELNGSASSIGYRAMHQRLQVDHCLVTDRETVRQVLKIVDPDGVERRQRHRLKRRQ